MSDDQNDKSQSGPKVSKSQELSKENQQPQEGPKESKVVELRESFSNKSQPGNQGLILNPVGSHDSDPFVSQDTPSPSPSSTPVQTTAPKSVPGEEGNTSNSDE